MGRAVVDLRALDDLKIPDMRHFFSMFVSYAHGAWPL